MMVPGATTFSITLN